MLAIPWVAHVTEIGVEAGRGVGNRVEAERSDREDHVAIVVATSEFEELIGLADEIHVMRLGRLVTTMPAEEATYARILHHALP